MAREPTTRLIVSGHRFLVRRIEHALLRRDVRMIHEPMRAHARSLLMGCVLSIFGAVACLVVGFVRPEGAIGDAVILMVKESGALYVRVGETWHPALNLASARLIAGMPAMPTIVSAAQLRKTKRGALLGIPGAPAVVPDALPKSEGQWTVCDGSAGTTVIAGPATVDQNAQALAGDQTMLTRSRSDRTTYLLYDGRRARISLDDRAVVRALRLESLEPMEVSPSVLNAIPEAPPIVTPAIPGAGRPGPARLGGAPVGSVIRVGRADADELYVVLEGGVQRVGRVAADIVRFSDSQGDPDIRAVTADAIGATPVIERLAVASFPDTVSTPHNESVICAQWQPDDKDSHSVLAGRAVPLPAGQGAVRLAQADGTGPNVDNVFIPPGRCLYVQSTYKYLITDTGVRFSISDAEAAAALGLSPEPSSAPWPIVKLLVEGPQLSRANALVAHDGMASERRAVALTSATPTPQPG
jgi:type VII secretion protein EccB